MSIKNQWKRLKSWDQRWGRFTEDGWVRIDRTRRQFADSIRNLPVTRESSNGSVTTGGAVATSEID